MTAKALLKVQIETYVAERTIRCGIREEMRATSRKVKELTVAAYTNMKNGNMALLDYLSYVGSLSRNVRKRGKNCEEPNDEEVEDM